jgi:D-3-phosphoglycerate dehydrogenase
MARFEILVTHHYLDQPGLGLLEAAGCRVHFLPQDGGRAEVESRLAATRFDGVLSRIIPISGAAMASCPSLRVISRAAAGYDSIDVAAATARGIAVLNAVGANAQSVAEYAVGMMLNVARNITRHNIAIQAGGWERPRLGLELRGRRLGLVGYGRIARATGHIAQGIGMKVAAWSPNLAAAGDIAPVARAETLHDLIRGSDVISLHAPLTAQSRNMIGAAELALMGGETILVNTGRGGLVDEAALGAALREGRIWGAGIDVLTAEPPPRDHPLLGLPNCVLSPHVAGATTVARSATAGLAASNLLDILLGRTPSAACFVNPEVMDRPAPRA